MTEKKEIFYLGRKHIASRIFLPFLADGVGGWSSHKGEMGLGFFFSRGRTEAVFSLPNNTHRTHGLAIYLAS